MESFEFCATTHGMGNLKMPPYTLQTRELDSLYVREGEMHWGIPGPVALGLCTLNMDGNPELILTH